MKVCMSLFLMATSFFFGKRAPRKHARKFSTSYFVSNLYLLHFTQITLEHGYNILAVRWHLLPQMLLI